MGADRRPRGAVAAAVGRPPPAAPGAVAVRRAPPLPSRRSSRPRARALSTEAVRRFYTEAPFPSYGARDTLSSLHLRAERSPLARLLDEAIPQDARVLDLGCGTGQMTIFLANGKRRRVVGADLTRASLLALARPAARRFGVRTDALRRDRPATAGPARGAIRRGPLARGSAPHAGAARGLRPPGAAGAAGRDDRARCLQRVRAPSPPPAPSGSRACPRLRVIPFDPVLGDRQG